MKDPLPVERITLKNIGENILAVFNLEKGLFFTFQQFLFYPKQATHDYLFTEKRRRFVKPINLLLLVTGLAVFVILKVSMSEGEGEMIGTLPKGISPYWENIFKEAGTKVLEYINAIQLLSVPILAFLSFLFFGSKTYNLAEHFVISAYVASVHGILSILIMPLILYNQTLVSILTLLLIVYFYYAFMLIFDCKNGKGFLVISALLLLRTFLLSLCLGLIFSIYFLLYPMQ